MLIRFVGSRLNVKNCIADTARIFPCLHHMHDTIALIFESTCHPSRRQVAPISYVPATPHAKMPNVSISFSGIGAVHVQAHDFLIVLPCVFSGGDKAN